MISSTVVRTGNEAQRDNNVFAKLSHASRRLVVPFVFRFPPCRILTALLRLKGKFAVIGFLAIGAPRGLSHQVRSELK